MADRAAVNKAGIASQLIGMMALKASWYTGAFSISFRIVHADTLAYTLTLLYVYVYVCVRFPFKPDGFQIHLAPHGVHWRKAAQALTSCQTLDLMQVI